MKKIKSIFILAVTSVCMLSLYGCNFKKTGIKNTALTISAAASLKEVMAELESEFNKENSTIDLTFNFGSSGSLQKQIEQGAPCDIFISAGESQMETLLKEGLLNEDSLKTILKNNLVLISNSKEVKGLNDLTSSKVTHIAVGDPASVPAGKYADESLTNLKLKNEVKAKLVYAKDVKEVFSWVASGNAEAGFVYKSDTFNNNSVNVVETILEQYHSPIFYPAAIIKGTRNYDAAKTFVDFLTTDKAKEIFKKYKYEPLY